MSVVILLPVPAIFLNLHIFQLVRGHEVRQCAIQYSHMLNNIQVDARDNDM